MRNRDLVSGSFWIAVGALFIVGALQQGLFRKGIPGPGFLPFLTAGVFIFLSLLVVGGALKKRRGGIGVEKAGEFSPSREGWKKILLAFLGLIGYGIFLGYAGYLLTTFVFMVFTMQIIEPKGWRISLLIAFATVLSTFMLFTVLLQVQLPKGFLGF